MRRFTKAITAMFLIVATLAVTECKKDTDPNSAEFKIVKEYLDINATSASITGSFEYPGKINSIKVAVGQRHDFTDAHSFLADIHEKEFEVTLTGLTTGTEYRYRYEVDYGSSKPFITEAKTFTTQSESPTVKTIEALAIDSTTFRIKCEVLLGGGQEVNERGICWNTYGDPTMDDETIQHASGGLGQYTIRMENLTMGKKYYVRAYAKNEAGVGLSEEVLDFKTEAPTGISVDIELSCNPEEGGTTSGEGTYEVGTQCAATAAANAGYTFVNWTENDIQVSSNTEYTFTVTTSRSLVANFTMQANVITAQIDPEDSGTVTGAGGFNYGEVCTLTATAKTGYDFVKWTKGGTTVSTETNYTITVTESATYVAHFQAKSYVVTASANPIIGGSVAGGGTISYGQSCTVHAIPAENYKFVNWTDEGDVVSTNASYSFIVTSNRNLVANFSYDGGGIVPQGAINGRFSISATKQVYFSQGNLQYIGSAVTPYWKFAENQWDYFGTATGQNSSSQNVDRDLFGWGTSGYHDSNDIYNVNFQPWSTSKTQVGINTTYNKWGYGPSKNMPSPNLTGTSANYDWGVYNKISNGGNTTNTWRTLTGGYQGEWYYVLKSRNASTVNGVANARYAKAKVADVQGVILFPDNYTHPSEVAQPLGINDEENAGWNGNNYSATDFALMQASGAVFLPTAGNRSGTVVDRIGIGGSYWSTSHYDELGAGTLDFDSETLDIGNIWGMRYAGFSVRLVCPAQ